MDTDSFQEKDRVRPRTKSPGMSDNEYYTKKIHEALHRQRSLHEEHLLQQPDDSQSNLRAEASVLASQSSTQLNAEIREMEYDTSAEKDEFHKIQMEKEEISVIRRLEKTPKKRRRTR